MTIGYILWAALLAIAFIAVTLGKPLHQALTPIPDGDMTEIVRFLGHRDQTPVVVKKRIELPQGRLVNVYGRPRIARFYNVAARDADGAEHRHDLAIEGREAQIDLILHHQGPEGYWTKALQ